MKNPFKWTLCCVVALLFVVAACSSSSEDEGVVPDSVPPDTAADVDLPPPESPGRYARRMSIEQIARSIPIVTNGIAWTEDFGGGPMDMLAVLAPTLGAPDYLLVTEENLEPSLIIAKFMQDASHRICTRWVERDKSLPSAERTLIAHPAWGSLVESDVKTSLRALKLRFLSNYLAPGNDTGIADLYGLFVAASAAAPKAYRADDGWLAVCLALMTDPEFVLY